MVTSLEVHSAIEDSVMQLEEVNLGALSFIYSYFYFFVVCQGWSLKSFKFLDGFVLPRRDRNERIAGIDPGECDGRQPDHWDDMLWCVSQACILTAKFIMEVLARAWRKQRFVGQVGRLTCMLWHRRPAEVCRSLLSVDRSYYVLLWFIALNGEHASCSHGLKIQLCFMKTCDDNE